MKMNLQFFAEEETIETTESVEQVENEENAEPNAEEQQEEVTEKTFTKSELDSIIQKRIERERKSLQSDPRVDFINNLANSYGFSSADEYMEAVKQQQEQEKIDQLVAQNIPKEYAQEMLENKKFRERYESEQQVRQKQEKETAEFNEFIEANPTIKGEDISPEVWQLREEKGISLLDAYNRIEIKELMAQQENIKLQAEQETINKINKNGITPGSVASGNKEHPSKWANMSDEDFAKEVERAKQGLL
ncbi:MAG: hypothetical protein N4A63_16320 [Vallitalea sp.]|jgi:hypothetical protein|nr:hypothetical protein [Vallitalea sp.]